MRHIAKWKGTAIVIQQQLEGIAYTAATWALLVLVGVCALVTVGPRILVFAWMAGRLVGLVLVLALAASVLAHGMP
jgi:hypothetical protein